MATGTYKVNPTATVATYGENSAPTKALQTAINAVAPTKIAVDSKYGDQTKGAYNSLVSQGYTYANGAFTKAPAVDTTKTTDTALDTTRYARTANPNDALIKNLTDKLDATVGDAPDKALILKEKQAGAQSMIDAITAEFNRVISDQQKTNAGYNDRVRASNISSGLGGSDFATANAIGQEQKNQKAIDMINEEKSAKIAAILANVDSRASDEYRTQREIYVKSLGDNLDRVKEAKKEDLARATGSVRSLAQQGVSVDKLKTADPKTYDTLLKESGGSPIELESIWNANLPDNLKIKYSEKMTKDTDGNTVIHRYGIDPMNPGQIKESSYKIAVPYEQLATGTLDETKDGRMIMKYPDGTIKYLTEIDELTRSIINKNNADASGAGKNEDPAVMKELQDAQDAIDKGADADKVRRAFLDLYPKKGDLFLKYTKQQY